MSKVIASTAFQPHIRMDHVPREQQEALFAKTRQAYSDLHGRWQRTLLEHWGALKTADCIDSLLPEFRGASDIDADFFRALNEMASLIPHVPHLLTYSEFEADLLPTPLSPDTDWSALDEKAIAYLLNISALAYMHQTSRWYEAVERYSDAATAMMMEKQVWLDLGAADADTGIGLTVSPHRNGDVETLFRGLQLAPGETGLLDAEFMLHNNNHGVITHFRCPALDRFGTSDIIRREHACVICVIGMRTTGELVDKNMQCRPRSLPPYHQDPGYACQWEYWLPRD